MNNILRYSQLAKALGVSNASISMAIKNGKLNPDERDKTIDITDPLNKLWLDGQIRKGKTFDINRIYDKITKVKKEKVNTEPQETSVLKETPTTDKSERVYADLKRIEYEQKKATLKKTKYEAKKLELQNYKLEGSLIPFDAAQSVFIYAAELFRNTYVQEVDGLANIFVERLGGEHRHFIELQKELTEKINEIQKLVKENLLNGLDGIVEEYKELRSRGERT